MIDKPFISCIMMSSLDGGLNESRWSERYIKDGEDDYDYYYAKRHEINEDCSLLGKATVKKNFSFTPFHCETRTPVHDFTPYRGTAGDVKMAAVFDANGELAYRNEDLYGGMPLVVLGEDLVCEEYLQYLREQGVAYTFAGKDGRNYRQAMQSLSYDFGLKRVVLAGGGTLNGIFLKERLIDEISVVIFPTIDGLAGAATIFDYPGEADELPFQGQSLELLDVDKSPAGMVFVKYKVHK